MQSQNNLFQEEEQIELDFDDKTDQSMDKLEVPKKDRDTGSTIQDQSSRTISEGNKNEITETSGQDTID